MFHVILLCWCSWSLMAVFGLESVSVTEGESVTLYMSITEQQRKEGISWKFGANINIDKSLIAEIKSGNNEIKLHKDRPDERFNNRLKLDQTGSLTITNTTITHSGLYQITTSKNKTLLNKTFNITVYTLLSVPVISRDSSKCSSSSNCSVLCSVMNVSHVSLSWYKGNRLLSSISASDLNIRLSLPLEVEYQDNNTYKCVINNPITNLTQHLHITHICQPCSGSLSEDYIIPLSCAAGSLMIVTALLIFCICRKHRKTNQEDPSSEEEITYADPTFYKKQTHKQRCAVEEDVVYAGVMRR
ncbi:signaling lymphocytic activation molecule-like isoform X2 [Triplophysa dalaica]|uniref:signaling lymphocytic activation molecule-like isoform X2 n=1 Tax=Triplophysa dalaica TaxID=1582913 RepID=UPI0024DF95EE|nr:signaling lymphocytic activation molecule-like isoform X2 [Triplophysa dalaica]